MSARELNERDELFRLEADAHEASIKLWLEKRTREEEPSLATPQPLPGACSMKQEGSRR
jgi:hypothetical protein